MHFEMNYYKEEEYSYEEVSLSERQRMNYQCNIKKLKSHLLKIYVLGDLSKTDIVITEAILTKETKGKKDNHNL